MKALFCVALHQALAPSTRTAQAAPAPSEAELFRARDRAMRRQRPWRVIGWIRAMIPAALADRIAAHRAERQLQVQIQRLEDLSGHLLDDIGVAKAGPSDYIVLSDDMNTARAARLAEARLRAGAPRRAPAAGLAAIRVKV